MLVAIIIVEQTSRIGVMEHFLDVLQESYIVFYNVLQGDYTIVEATGSRTRINVETRM